MQTAATDRTKLVEPRRSPVILLLGCLALISLGLDMLATGDGSLLAWITVGFFGIAATGVVLELIRPSELRFDAEGFAYTSNGGFRSGSHQWDSVSAFRVEERHYLGFPVATTVVFDRSDRRLGLPRTYGVEPVELAVLMNQRRNAALEIAPTT